MRGRGRRDLTHWPTWLCPSLHAAGTCLRLGASSKWGSPAEIWSQIPGVFSQLGSLIERKDLRFPALLCAGLLPARAWDPSTQTLELRPELRVPGPAFPRILPSPPLMTLHPLLPQPQEERGFLPWWLRAAQTPIFFPLVSQGALVHGVVLMFPQPQTG